MLLSQLQKTCLTHEFVENKNETEYNIDSTTNKSLKKRE